jgi:hypothetical protein
MSKNTDADENVHCVPTTYGLIVLDGFPLVNYILGSPFMKSVVSGFDVRNSELRFAQRK